MPMNVSLSLLILYSRMKDASSGHRIEFIPQGP